MLINKIDNKIIKSLRDLQWIENTSHIAFDVEDQKNTTG
jgi:hypothetical protein